MNDTTLTTLNVEGMTCPSCVHHIDVALKDLEGVNSVEVKLREGKVAIVHASALASRELIKALREAGYESRAV